jgi:hypothetical protein
MENCERFYNQNRRDSGMGDERTYRLGAMSRTTRNAERLAVVAIVSLASLAATVEAFGMSPSTGEV